MDAGSTHAAPRRLRRLLSSPMLYWGWAIVAVAAIALWGWEWTWARKLLVAAGVVASVTAVASALAILRTFRWA